MIFHNYVDIILDAGSRDRANAVDENRQTTGDITVPQDGGAVATDQSLKQQHRLGLLNVLAVLIGHMKFTSIETRLETLRWFLWLHKKLPKRVSWFILFHPKSKAPLLFSFQ